MRARARCTLSSERPLTIICAPSAAESVRNGKADPCCRSGNQGAPPAQSEIHIRLQRLSSMDWQVGAAAPVGNRPRRCVIPPALQGRSTMRAARRRVRGRARQRARQSVRWGHDRSESCARYRARPLTRRAQGRAALARKGRGLRPLLRSRHLHPDPVERRLAVMKRLRRSSSPKRRLAVYSGTPMTPRHRACGSNTWMPPGPQQ